MGTLEDFIAPLLCLGAALGGCTPAKSSFTCASSADCARSTQAGVCEVNGFCSFADDSCAFPGRRYALSAGLGLGGQCVGAEAALPVPHVSAAAAFCGGASLMLTGNAVIDTGALAIDGGTLPAGVTFDAAAQTPAGPELAVLRVAALNLAAGVEIRVTGSRPLVVIACGDIVFEAGALLDASARGPLPGAGGAAPRQGAGRGGDGASGAGGGGAGFAQPGAKAGDDNGSPGGDAGAAYSDLQLTVLEGGSGGGIGDTGGCAVPLMPSGAGGGAVELFSSSSIHLLNQASINAGGGGGSGGYAGGLCANYGAGSGGGSGGAIYLRAPSLQLIGSLFANGGAGGGGACDASDPGCRGGMGQDGPSNTTPSTGGVRGAANPSCGTAGGTGGTPQAAPTASPDDGCLTGGGGGAAGVVVLQPGS